VGRPFQAAAAFQLLIALKRNALSRKLFFCARAGFNRSRPEAASYGRKTVWCLVPVFQRDLGCCDALIGGELALKKVRPDPAGESVVFSQAEPSLGSENQT
jgi:hypothetical protein